MTMKTYKRTVFLNVDLDLRSRLSLEPFVSALGDQVNVMYSGRHKGIYEAHLELNKMVKNPDIAIHGFNVLIRKLPPRIRTLWDTAIARDFNVGIQGGMHPFSFELPLARKTLEIASRMKARIVITVYAPQRVKTRVP